VLLVSQTRVKSNVLEVIGSSHNDSPTGFKIVTTRIKSITATVRPMKTAPIMAALVEAATTRTLLTIQISAT